MAMKLYSDTYVQNIANAIRNCNGTENTYKISQMAPAINTMYQNILDNVYSEVFTGTSNKQETINNGTNLRAKKLTINGNYNQDGTPSTITPIDITPVTSVMFEISDGTNSQTRTFDLDGNVMFGLIDGFADTLRLENGHSYLDKKIKKIKLTSSMSWTYSSARHGFLSSGFANTYGLKGNTNNIISNCFQYSATTWALPYKMGWGSDGRTLWLDLESSSTITSVAAWKTYLDNNDVYIYAEADTPETIDLGSLNDIFTYEGTNNITVTTNINTTYDLEYIANPSSIIGLTLLEEYEIDTPNSQFYYPIDFSKYEDYSMIFIACDNVTFNTTEWLYVGLKNNTTFGYLGTSSGLLNVSIPAFPLLTKINSKWISISTGSGALNNKTIVPDGLFMKTYYNTNQITGGTVYLYGIKVDGVE